MFCPGRPLPFDIYFLKQILSRASCLSNLRMAETKVEDQGEVDGAEFTITATKAIEVVKALIAGKQPSAESSRTTLKVDGTEVQVSSLTAAQFAGIPQEGTWKSATKHECVLLCIHGLVCVCTVIELLRYLKLQYYCSCCLYSCVPDPVSFCCGLLLGCCKQKPY